MSKSVATKPAPVVATVPVPTDFQDLVSAKAKEVQGMDPKSLLDLVVDDAKREAVSGLSRTYVRAMTLPVILAGGIDRQTYVTNTGLSKSYVSDLGTLAVAVHLGFGVSTPAKAKEWARVVQGIKTPEVRAAIRADKATAKAVRDALTTHTLPNGQRKPVISATATASPNEVAPVGPTATKAEEAEARTKDATAVVLPSLASVEAFLTRVATGDESGLSKSQSVALYAAMAAAGDRLIRDNPKVQAEAKALVQAEAKRGTKASK